MKRKNATRSALFTSIISLLLCVSMLVGTTFAWFTDEVKSGVNVINAGKLDVELYHGKTTNPTSKVDAGTKLFTDTKSAEIELWEPGVVAYTNLKVANDGNLALKYQMALSFTNANTVDGKSLADVLKIALIPGGVQGTTREAVLAEAKTGTALALQDFKKSGTLEKGADSDVFGLVVYWPDNNSNEFDNQFNLNNGKPADDGSKTLKIDLGITLFATQLQYEEDSFGNDYDENIWQDAMFVASEEDLISAIAAGETAIMLEDDIALTSAVEIPVGATVALNLNGHSLTAANETVNVFENSGELTITGTGTIATRNLRNNRGAKLVIDGDITIIGGAPTAGSAIWNEGDAVIRGATINQTNTTNYAIQHFNNGTMTIDDVIVNGQHGGVAVHNGTVTIKGGTFTNANEQHAGHTLYVTGGEVIVEGGTFNHDQVNASAHGNALIYTTNGTVTINGGTFDSEYAALAYTGMNVSITAGTFANKAASVYQTAGEEITEFVAPGYKAIENNGVYYVVPDGVSNVVTTAAQLQTALDAATGDATIVLAADITGDVNVSQKEGVNIVIDGKNYQYDGAICVYGYSRYTGAETLTIKNINFVTTGEVTRDFIHSYGDKTVTDQRYAHNVTIEDCTFTNENGGTVVAARFRQAYDITIKNCKVDGLYSVLWADGSNGITIDNVTANCAYEGISFGTSADVSVKNSNITVGSDYGYGVRVDASVANKLTIENSTLNAVAAVVVRKATAAYTADLNGTFNGKIILTGSDFKANTELTPVTGNLTVTVNGAPYIVTNTGLKDAFADGATEVSVAQNMTITSADLATASTDLTVNVAGGATVTVASGAATSKNLTFAGDRNSKVVLVNTNPGYEGKLSYQDGANLTFKGITFDANEISGICARGGEVEFIDCFITGELEQTIGSKFVFTGCTFDVGVTQVGYGCTDVVFDGCTFETDGYGIKIYKEANENVVNLTVKGCSFKNTGSAARSAILLDHILDGFSYNITVENCTFEGYTATPTATYNKWAARMIVADSFVQTADGQYIFSYQTGETGGPYHKILTADKLVVTVR